MFFQWRNSKSDLNAVFGIQFVWSSGMYPNVSLSAEISGAQGKLCPRRLLEFSGNLLYNRSKLVSLRFKGFAEHEWSRFIRKWLQNCPPSYLMPRLNGIPVVYWSFRETCYIIYQNLLLGGFGDCWTQITR